MKKYYTIVFIVIGVVIALGMPQQTRADCSSDRVSFYIITRDAEGEIIPSINYIIYEQNTNPDGVPYLGRSRGSGKTDDGGQASKCASISSTGEYAIAFYQYSKNYGFRIVWDGELAGDEEGGYTSEVNLSYLQVIIRDAQGTLLKDVKFDIYVQEYDIDGQPIIGENRLNQEKLISSSYTTGVTGTTRAYLASDVQWTQGGVYVLRIHGTGNTYFYLWEQRLHDNVSNRVDYRLGTVRVVQEDAYGQLLTDRKFSIYQQVYDAHENPVYGDLVVKNLDVGAVGFYDVYLPTGSYTFRFPSSVSGDYYTKWEVNSRDGRFKRFTYRLSSLRIIIFNDQNQLLTSQAFSIGLQGTDAAGNPGIIKTHIKSNTGKLGYKDLNLVPRKYALVYGGKKIYNVEVFENQPTIIDYPRAMSLRPAGGELALTTSLANSTLTLRPLPAADVRGIAVRKHNVGTPFQVRANEIVHPYTVVFFYNKERLRDRGINGDKLRIAFYNSRTGRWSLIGNIYYNLRRLSATVRDPGIYTLIELK